MGQPKRRNAAPFAEEHGANLDEKAANFRGNNSLKLPETASDLRNSADEPDLSQDGLARALGAESWDCDARYVSSRGKWFFWDGSHWAVDDLLDCLTQTRNFIRERADDLEQRALRKSETLETVAAEKLMKWAKREAKLLKHKGNVSAVENLAQSNEASAALASDFDQDRLLLGTPGGTVDLRTGELRAALRSDMITKRTSVEPTEAGTRPERWLSFISEIFDGDQDVISFMQRAAGYALTGQTTEHKLLFLYGTGRNGKSVFLNALFEIWGDYSRRAASATFLNSQNERHPTDLAGLQGARLVAGSELPKGKTWDESVIKDLTGGDKMTARFMRGDFFDFDPELTLIIAGNNQPSFRGVDEAIRSRVVLVPFTQTIPLERRDMGLPDKLRAEAPAILRWAINGALQWRNRGLDVPACILAASDQYFNDEDVLGQFIADEIAETFDGFVTTTELHQRFTQWCETQGLRTWTLRTLNKDLKTRNWQESRRNHGRGFAGVGLK